MEQNKEYYAFISYKREDERWAKWLQHKLEHYRLPSNLNGRTDLPREIRPVFRDTSELNPGNLPQQINDALAASRHLIVVCSPRSARSEWVNKEVVTFIAMGKQDCIIPFIIDGRPMADDTKEECFPPAIRNLPAEQELLGANITEMGREAAAVKTIAQMFGVRFDTLWRRYEREQKRKRIVIIIAVAMFVLAILGVAAYIAKSRADLQNAYGQLEDQITLIENQRDSISSQYLIINSQQDSLVYINSMLIDEKNNLILSNRQVLINESKLLAELAKKKCDEGNYIEARRIALSALPHNLSNPDRPFVIEAEAVLRKTFERDFYPIRTRKPLSSSISPNGDIIVYAEILYVDIRDAKTMERLHVWTYGDGQDGPLNMVSFNEDGTKMLFPFWNGAILADSRTGTVIDTLPNPGFVRVAQFSSDFSKILTMGDSLIIFDAKDNKVLYSDDYVGEFAVFYPKDDNKILVCEKGRIKMIDIISGESTFYDIGEDHIYSIDMDPTGRYFATEINTDHELVIWDIATREKKILDVKNEVAEFAFDVDGEYLFVIDRYGNTLFFDVDSWQRHSISDSPSIANIEKPHRYSGVVYSHDTICQNIISTHYCHNCSEQKEVIPQYIISALTRHDRNTPIVTLMLQCKYNNVSVVYYSNDNENELGALFCGKSLVNTFRIWGEYDYFGDIFLNYDGKYFGFRNENGFAVYEAKTGRFVRFLHTSYSGNLTIYDRYAIILEDVPNKYDFADIVIIDLYSEIEVQRYKNFPASSYDASIEVVDSRIYVSSKNEQIFFTIKPLQELINEASRQFRNYGKRQVTYKSFYDNIEEDDYSGDDD